MQNNDFDLVKYFNKFVAGTQKPTKAEIINKIGVGGQLTLELSI